MAEFTHIKRDSAVDELAKIVAGVPKNFPVSVPTEKEVLTDLIHDTHKDLTKLEITEKYFRHAMSAGSKISVPGKDDMAHRASFDALLQKAVQGVREKKDFLGWLCEQWETLQ